MDYPEILVIRTLRIAKGICALARKLCRTKGRTTALLRSKEESEMGVSMRDLQQLVSREGDTIRPSCALWDAKGLRRPSGFR